MPGPRRHLCIHCLSLIGLVASSQLLLVGCGAMPSSPFDARVLFVADCDAELAQSQDASLVVLDWTGGISPIYPGLDLLGLDLAQFPTADGSTLADHETEFKELVRRQVSEIFCASGLAKVAVINGESEDEGAWADTVVQITQETKPNGGADIGQGEYDPCDLQQDNSAVIFGRRLELLGGAYDIDEWVNVFANVTAHEIAHTLGFGHIARKDRPEADPQRALFVELMLDQHTMSEMRRPNRFIAEQSSCTTQELSTASVIKNVELTSSSTH